MNYSIIESFRHEYPTLDENAVNYRELGNMNLLVEYENGSAIVYNDFGKTFRRLPNGLANMTDEERQCEFGERLRYAMYMKGMTQGELSYQTGITQAVISRYVTGKAKPGFINIDKICQALGCSMDDLRYLK